MQPAHARLRQLPANDADPDPGDGLAAELVARPSNGTLVLNANGSFAYKPNRDFAGTESLVYKARDSAGALSGEATVTLVVRGRQRPRP